MDEVIGRFLAQNGATIEYDLDIGRAHIDCSNLGCDVQFTTVDGSAVPVSSPAALRSHTVRLFSPVYCAGKDLHPFRGKIIAGIEFPLDQDTLIEKLGPPNRTSNTVRRYDEYDLAGVNMRFVRANAGKDIVFVEIVSRRRTLHSIVERESLLQGSARTHWSARTNAYVKHWGEVDCIYLDVELGVDVLAFKRTDCYILVTNGASNYRMTVPNPTDICRIELFMYVRNPEERLVQRLARSAAFPQVENKSLGHGDTINWEVPVESGSNLTADLIIYSIVREDRDFSIVVEGDVMKLLWCVPITVAELEFKKANDIKQLLGVFDKVKHPKILDPLRKSYV